MLAAWSGATDDWDKNWDVTDHITAPGYAAVYHAYDPPEWTGPTDFYRIDYRAPMSPGETKTWAPIHLWADAEQYYEGDKMYLSMMADVNFLPPANWRYVLELTYVPEGVEDAPEVGKTWELALDRTLTVEVPTFYAENGLDGYQFAFTVEAIPEPATLAGLLMGTWII
ncbi:MAG: hypothetical protein ABIG44_16315, partial [Planctomycetota bacterium]